MRHRHCRVLGTLLSVTLFATLPGCLTGKFDSPGYDYNYDSPAALDEDQGNSNSPVMTAGTEPVPGGSLTLDTAPSTVVTLAAGDTLYSLSVRHLGTGKRWREIADLNGLSEAQVRNLSIGQAIKIPAR